MVRVGPEESKGIERNYGLDVDHRSTYVAQG